MDADRRPVDAPLRLAFFIARPARIAEHEQTRREGHRFADRLGREALGQRHRHRLGGFVLGAAVDRLGELFDPRIVGFLRPEGFPREFVFVE